MQQRMCSAASKLTDAHCRPTCTSDTTDDYFNDIFVYDAKMDMFGVATASSTSEPCLLPPGCGPYPVNVNVPQNSVHGNRIFTMGGEADARNICGMQYQHYPTLAMLGTITPNRDLAEGVERPGLKGSKGVLSITTRRKEGVEKARGAL